MSHEFLAFVKVVERGNFSASAVDLGLTPSAMSKLITRLEDRLGVRLLHRTTRRLSMTAEGETFYLRARDILQIIEDAESEVSQAGSNPRGKLRVNCVTGFAYNVLALHLPKFMEMYPDIQVELAVTDKVVDLLVENADVGIRSGVIGDQGIITRKFSEFERMIYSSTMYLERKGIPKTPSDLATHDCIVLGNRQQQPTKWPFFVNGNETEINVNGRITADNAETALRIIMAGGGIARVANMQVEHAVRRGWVVPILTEFHVPKPVPLSAVYPPGRHRMPKVRVFLDFLINEFSDPTWKHIRMPQDLSAQALTGF
jgi:DNA-binding transcriptional LysR family regulator